MRLLFIAYPCSIHTARWINQLPVDKWDIHLFPIHEGAVHADLHSITVHSFYRTWPLQNNPDVDRRGIYWPVVKGRGRIKTAVERLAPVLAADSARLARTIRYLKPDIIHVLEMQSAGYLALESWRRLNGYGCPPCIYSSWGSDLFLYGTQPDHERRIRAFLGRCDYYIPDCHRDERLVREFGFKGETLGVLPVGGGYDLRHMRQFWHPGPPSSRRVIALKGYQHIRGANALVALQALRMCSDLLCGFELVVYSASDEVRNELKSLSRIEGFLVTELEHSSHDELLKLLGRARIAIGVGQSDGTPSTMLEAMIMGALPVQSDTISTAEWIEDGRTGLLVSATSAESIADALRRALTDDELVDQAAGINADVTQRLDTSLIQPKVIKLYEEVARTSRQ